MYSIKTKTLQLKHDFGISRGVRKEVHNLFIQWDDGYGEGAPVYYHGQTVEDMQLIAALAMPELLNKKRAHSIVIEWLIEQYPQLSGMIQAIDLALYDLHAKQCQMPLYQYLQLPKPEYIQSSFTIGLDRKDIMLQKLKEAGDFPILKIKVGSQDDIEILKALWNESHKPVYIDANEGWTFDQAVQYLPQLQALGVQLVEQPFPSGDLESYKKLRETNPTSLPIIIDEGVQSPGDVAQWAEIADGVNVKLAKCGGIYRALQVIEEARKHRLQVMLGCMIESSLGVSAAAHISSLVDYVDLDGAVLLANDPFDGMKLNKGIIELPDRPGIGAIPIPQE